MKPENILGDLVRHKKLLIISISSALVLGFVLFSDHGMVKRFQLESRKSEIFEEILAEKLEMDSLTNEIKSMRYDTVKIERIAREKYGLIKKGEKVYKIKSNRDN